MLCQQKKTMTSKSAAPAACPKCHAKQPTQNGCCKKVVTHHSLKAEYQRPAVVSFDHTSAIVLAVLAQPFAFVSEVPAASQLSTTGPPIAVSAPDRCALVSSYRI
jgi:hypothetical protein